MQMESPLWTRKADVDYCSTSHSCLLTMNIMNSQMYLRVHNITGSQMGYMDRVFRKVASPECPRYAGISLAQQTRETGFEFAMDKWDAFGNALLKMELILPAPSAPNFLIMQSF